MYTHEQFWPIERYSTRFYSAYTPGPSPALHVDESPWCNISGQWFLSYDPLIYPRSLRILDLSFHNEFAARWIKPLHWVLGAQPLLTTLKIRGLPHMKPAAAPDLAATLHPITLPALEYLSLDIISTPMHTHEREQPAELWTAYASARWSTPRLTHLRLYANFSPAGFLPALLAHFGRTLTHLRLPDCPWEEPVLARIGGLCPRLQHLAIRGGHGGHPALSGAQALRWLDVYDLRYTETNEEAEARALCKTLRAKNGLPWLERVRTVVGLFDVYSEPELLSHAEEELFSTEEWRWGDQERERRWLLPASGLAVLQVPYAVFVGIAAEYRAHKQLHEVGQPDEDEDSDSDWEPGQEESSGSSEDEWESVGSEEDDRGGAAHTPDELLEAFPRIQQARGFASTGIESDSEEVAL